MPQLTQQLPYEPDDIFDHLIQTAAPQASAVEWLQHTGNTNPAAATAELAQKPDLGMQRATHSMPFTKIADLASFSRNQFLISVTLCNSCPPKCSGRRVMPARMRF